MKKHECDDVLLLSGIYPEYMYKKLTDHHFNKNDNTKVNKKV